MAFRRKSHQEIVGELLSELTSGIVNEAHRFKSGTLDYKLNSTPALNISSVRGTVEDIHYTFIPGADYKLEENMSIRWVESGAKPDSDTLFYVNYNSQEFTSPITDRNIGSVTRTIVEAISGEIATLYAQLEKAYFSAFIDTAEGKSLEFVVSILGVQRIRAGSAEGEVTFSRATYAPGDITIPLGTVISAGEQKFETTEARTLAKGDRHVDVPIRAKEPGEMVEAGTITVMPKPIVGIERVTNDDATVVSTTDENDDRLRKRAKAALYGTGKATADAIKYAALERGASSVLIREMPYDIPGEVEVIVSCAEKDKKAIDDVINETRAAGVKFYTRLPEEIRVRFRLELTVVAGLLEDEKSQLREGIKTQIEDYITYLSPGERVLASRITSIAMSDERVSNARISVVMVQVGDFNKTTARVMANQDILIQPKEKAVCEDITINMAAESIEVPPEEEGEEFYPINVEAEVWVKLVGDTTKVQAQSMIEAKARVYLSEMGVGDTIKWVEFRKAITGDKWNEVDKAVVRNFWYEVDKAVVRNFHSFDGLVVTLDREDSVDTIRKKENIVVEAVKVQFV